MAPDVLGRSTSVRASGVIDIVSSTHLLRCTTGVRPGPNIISTVHCRPVFSDRGSWSLLPSLCERYADLRLLSSTRDTGTHGDYVSVHWWRPVVDARQPAPVESSEDRDSLVRHRSTSSSAAAVTATRLPIPSPAHCGGSWSWSFHWRRSVNEDTCRADCICLFCGTVGVAQWLGRRSLTGGLSLICAWSMVDVWPLRG